MPRKTKDAYSETWELWRKVLAAFSLFVWIPLTLWIGLPVGLSLTISTAGIITAWRSLHATGDPRLGSYVENSWVYKIAALVTRAKGVATQYWELWKESKPNFFVNFFRSIGGGMPFPDPWHLTPEEQRAFEESEANTPTSIKDYSAQFSWKNLIPKRLSTLWSMFFALAIAAIEIPVTQLTGITVSWGFSLPVWISYPISAFFLFVLAQFYCITRLTQGNWGEERSLIPAPTIMINRLTKDHLKPGIFTSSIAFIVTAIIVGSFVVYFSLPVVESAISVVLFSVAVALVVISVRAKKPWRAPWREHLDNVHAMSNAFNTIVSEEMIPNLVNIKDFPSDSEMDEIRAIWREKRELGELTEEEAAEAPKSSNKIAVFVYRNSGLTPEMLSGNEDTIEQLLPNVFSPAFLFPERTDNNDEPIPGTVTDEGFQMLYSSEHKNFYLRDLVARKYPIWDEELAIHKTIIRQIQDYFNLPIQLVDTIWHTEEDSPSHILELIVFPITTRTFSLTEFAQFANNLESNREIDWLRTKIYSVNGLSNHISILLSDNVRDERMKFATNGLTVKRMIQEADWNHVFRQANVISSNGTLPEFKYSKQSTELVTTSSFMLPVELDRENVKYMAEEFKKLTHQEFVEVKGGWDYAKNANEATKRRAKDQKAFSILSAPSDPLDRKFMFGDYAEIALLGRRNDFVEQIDWVAGINSADQPAKDSFIKGDAPHLLIAGESGSGKPLHPDTTVWTEDRGIERICDLEPGDKILSANGYIPVKNVFPLRPEANTFYISVEGSEETRAAGKHLWPGRFSTHVDYSSIDTSMFDAHVFDDVEAAQTPSLSLLNRANMIDSREPINIQGDLPEPLNSRMPKGVGENSPQAINARSMHAMMGISPQLAAVLTVFSKNEFPDGHMIVANWHELEALFSVAGYTVSLIKTLDSGLHHVWCEDIAPLLNQIDFANTDFSLFSTSMAISSLITIDEEQIISECASALINCCITKRIEPGKRVVTHVQSGNGQSSKHLEFFARLVREGISPYIDTSKHDPIMFIDSNDGSTIITAEAVAEARKHIDYGALRDFVAAQHSAACGALSMLHQLDENVYAVSHSELMYFFLLCGLSVNTHESNNGLLLIESMDVKRRRDLFHPMFDEEKKDHIVKDNDLKPVHFLAGAVAAIGQVSLNSDGEPTMSLHTNNPNDVVRIMLAGKESLNIDKYSDLPYAVQTSQKPGVIELHPHIFNEIRRVITGNWIPSIGENHTCVQFTDDGVQPLYDRHAIVSMTGASYKDVSLILLGVEPDARTRCDYDMISPTGRSSIHAFFGTRELYTAATLKKCFNDSLKAGSTNVDIDAVVSTFALYSHTEKIKLSSVANSQPISVEDHEQAKSVTWSHCDIFSSWEETDMMCITVDSDEHTFVLADNGIISHNSVFVQSMLTQLSYNNKPSEMLEWLLDPKIGLQRLMNLDNCTKFLDPWTPNTHFFENCADFFAEGVDIMANERNAKLAKSPDPETGVPPEKLGEARETARLEGHSESSPHDLMFPYLFMCIEECATVFTDAGSKEEAAFQSEVLRHAGRIAREGRSAGVLEICMTQYPTNASIPAMIRNQMRRAGLKCRNSFASNIIIDEDGLEKLHLPGSVMLRDDNGEYRRARGFILRNGKPSRGEENDLMEILGSLPKNTSSQAGMTTNASGSSVVSFDHSLFSDMEMLFDDSFVDRMSHGMDNDVYYSFENKAGTKLEESVLSAKKTKSKLDSESDLNKMMERAGENTSAPWLKTDDSGKPISNAEYKKRADNPSIPSASGRRRSGRKSRL